MAVLPDSSPGVSETQTTVQEHNVQTATANMNDRQHGTRSTKTRSQRRHDDLAGKQDWARCALTLPILQTVYTRGHVTRLAIIHSKKPERTNRHIFPLAHAVMPHGRTGAL